MIPTTDICNADTLLKKPDINEDEDKPFPPGSYCKTCMEHGICSKQDIPETYKLRDQKHHQEVEDFKNTTGKHILYFCLFIMIAVAVAGCFVHTHQKLLNSLFDSAKAIVMIILGYLFGSKSN